MFKFLTQEVAAPVALKTTGIAFFIVAIILLLFTGCITEQKARHYAMDHPDNFADFCGRYYPAISAPIPATKRAENENYKSALDSFFAGSQWLAFRLSADSLRADSISRECSAILTEYARRVDSLTARIREIARNYKPCIPDTIPVPYPILDSAKLTAERQRSSELASAVQMLQSDKEVKEDAENRQRWYCYLFGLVTPFVLWGAFSILKRIL